MADTTVYTVSAGYIPYLGHGLGDFKVTAPSSGYKSGTARTVGDPPVQVWDGTEFKGPDSILPDGSLGRPRIRGSIGWFEYSTKMKPLYDKVQHDQMLKAKLQEMTEEFYRKDIRALSSEWLQSIISSGHLGDIQPTGVMAKTGGHGTPEETMQADRGGNLIETGHPLDVKKEDRAKEQLIGRANTVDMYMKDKRTGNIYRYDVTAMTFDTNSAHHGLSSFKDRQEKGITGEDLYKLINEEGHGEGSKAQQKLWKYFKNLQNQTWNPMIQKLRDRAYDTGDEATRSQIDDLKKGRTTLNKMGNDLMGLLENVRGTEGFGAAAGTAGDIKSALPKRGPTLGKRLGRARVSKRTKGQKGRKKKYGKGYQFDQRLREYKRNVGFHINATMKHAAIDAQTFSGSLSFVLHALGTMMKSVKAYQGSGKEYGYSTGITLGEGGAANFVVEVMHRINTKGKDVFLFKDLRSRDVLIHNEAHLSHVIMQRINDIDREEQVASWEQEAIRVNSNYGARLIADGQADIEIGSITTAAILDAHMGGGPQVGYASVIAPTEVNAEIDNFISQLHGKPQNFSKLLDSKGKILNMTGKNKPYEKKWKESLSKVGVRSFKRKLGLTSPHSKGRWGLGNRMGAIAKRTFDDKAIPDFWAAPYLTLLYPSTQMRVASRPE